MDRRQALKRAGIFALFGALAGATALTRRSIASDAPQVIKITAERFRFKPDEIALKSGQPAVLEITSLDFVHGFNVPDLGIRTNLIPGRVNSVAIKALAPGRHGFLCDNCCGGGHEDMNGTIVVTK